jgi:MoxR-like ATPase
MAKKKKSKKKRSKQQDWRIYRRAARPHDGIDLLPDPPSWRPRGAAPDDAPLVDRGASFRATPEMEEMVNAALYLRRPLLLTGKPGSGKSSLIHAVARELKLGRVLRWSITSRSTLGEALYRYDALGRLQQQQIDRGNAPDISQYLEFGPLGTALLPADRPRALLIDEIDKSDIDLPNDLLNVFEEGEFEIPELARLKQDVVEVREHEGDERHAVARGKVRCREFPFVVMTSNGERDFPPAFLRRCLRFTMPAPDATLLADIVTAHLGADIAAGASALIEDFAKRNRNEALATDQLLNAIFIITRERKLEPQSQVQLLKALLRELTSDPA